MAQSNLVTRVRWSVERALAHVALADSPTPALIAVSGGADSLCACDAVLAVAGGLRLLPILAHVHHGLRGADAEADAEAVIRFAAERGVQCHVERVDVKQAAQQLNVSIEVAARMMRYDALARVADQAHAAHVILGHHMDDQAETVLLRVLRGTGLSGLRGMLIHSPMPGAPHLTLIRPLLSTSRAEIETYCLERKLPARHDHTNDDVIHTRNRIRHELLPMLEKYNPSIRQALARLADTAGSDLDAIEFAGQRGLLDVTVRADAGALWFDRRLLCALSPGVQRAILRAAVKRVKGDMMDLKAAAVDEARDVLCSDAVQGQIALSADVRVDITPQYGVMRTRMQ